MAELTVDATDNASTSKSNESTSGVPAVSASDAVLLERDSVRLVGEEGVAVGAEADGAVVSLEDSIPVADVSPGSEPSVLFAFPVGAEADGAVVSLEDSVPVADVSPGSEPSVPFAFPLGALSPFSTAILAVVIPATSDAKSAAKAGFSCP